MKRGQGRKFPDTCHPFFFPYRRRLPLLPFSSKTHLPVPFSEPACLVKAGNPLVTSSFFRKPLRPLFPPPFPHTITEFLAFPFPPPAFSLFSDLFPPLSAPMDKDSPAPSPYNEKGFPPSPCCSIPPLYFLLSSCDSEKNGPCFLCQMSRPLTLVLLFLCRPFSFLSEQKKRFLLRQSSFFFPGRSRPFLLFFPPDHFVLPPNQRQKVIAWKGFNFSGTATLSFHKDLQSRRFFPSSIYWVPQFVGRTWPAPHVGQKSSSVEKPFPFPASFPPATSSDETTCP